MRLKLAALALLIALSIPRPAGACDPVADNDGPHRLDPAERGDTVAPSAVIASANVSPGGDGSIVTMPFEVAFGSEDFDRQRRASSSSRIESCVPFASRGH
jgi:hypothetical protein